MKGLIMDEVCFLLCKSLQPWHEDVWAHRFHAWIECIIIMSKTMSYYRWTHWGTYSVMMYYSTWVTSTRLVPWFVCEWMEYNWEELGLPMNSQCSMDEYIYIYIYVCMYIIDSIVLCMCAFIIMVKSLAYYGHSKGLHPIVSPFYLDDFLLP